MGSPTPVKDTRILIYTSYYILTPTVEILGTKNMWINSVHLIHADIHTKS